MSNKVGAHLGLTKNLGNYESAKFEAWVEQEVENVHDKDVWADLWDEIDSQLEEKLKEIQTVIK